MIQGATHTDALAALAGCASLYVLTAVVAVVTFVRWLHKRNTASKTAAACERREERAFDELG